MGIVRLGVLLMWVVCGSPSACFSFACSTLLFFFHFPFSNFYGEGGYIGYGKKTRIPSFLAIGVYCKVSFLAASVCTYLV
jgi:hypothetical protein